MKPWKWQGKPPTRDNLAIQNRVRAPPDHPRQVRDLTPIFLLYRGNRDNQFIFSEAAVYMKIHISGPGFSITSQDRPSFFNKLFLRDHRMTGKGCEIEMVTGEKTIHRM
jgi:hypothetical protein